MNRENAAFWLSVVCAVAATISCVMTTSIALGYNRHLSKRIIPRWMPYPDYGEKQ